VLDPRLAELIEAGIVVLGGAVVFAKPAPADYRPAADESLTGVEAGVNKIFLDELVDTEQPGWAAKCIAQGVLLAEQVHRRCASVTDLPIDVALSADLCGSTVIGGEAIETFPSSTWNERYPRTRQVWSGEPNATLVAELEGLALGRALDVGCGEGADAL
jgi:hypothetical protein